MQYLFPQHQFWWATLQFSHTMFVTEGGLTTHLTLLHYGYSVPVHRQALCKMDCHKDILSDCV